MARSSFSPFKPPSPRRFVDGFRDLGFFVRTRSRTDYVIAGIAAAMTIFIIFAFWHDSRFEAEPQIIYVQNWPANRTDDQIRADQKKDRIEREQVEAYRKAEFQKMQKATSGWL
ncbi:hypothetical protein HZF05_15155 [Sphingomonas sp. CGMCC 1.13654]|uniref:Uncharacterized protein n=1 Tax=Sphingomonas chungangi TaxID=2683589 RepID=A0A838L7F7_9SPHN|nr:hypothetical protein [Sphingomonas chungangi]MBA2935423.1 hypothetical protein [Sphingomonas chungangi]MVW56930.1 hypothetical protein [Sphingomonas chungangi]